MASHGFSGLAVQPARTASARWRRWVTALGGGADGTALGGGADNSLCRLAIVPSMVRYIHR